MKQSPIGIFAAALLCACSSTSGWKEVDEERPYRYKTPEEFVGVGHFTLVSGPRWPVGGDLRKVVEDWGGIIAENLSFNFPSGEDSAVSVTITGRRTVTDVKHTDMHWDGRFIGGGLRYLFLHGPPGDVYVAGEGGYLWWEGMDEARITHPGFDRTLFRRVGTQRFEPRDIFGYEVAGGIGADFFGRGSIVGLGTEVMYRYQGGTSGSTAHWMEWTFNFTFRF